MESKLSKKPECAISWRPLHIAVLRFGDSVSVCHSVAARPAWRQAVVSANAHVDDLGAVFLWTYTNKSPGQTPPPHHARGRSLGVNRPGDRHWRGIGPSAACQGRRWPLVEIWRYWESQRFYRLPPHRHRDQLYVQVCTRDWRDDPGPATWRRPIEPFIPNKIIESNCGGQLLRGR